MPATVNHSIVGRIVDQRYRVLRHIADGGMGSVFVAMDERLDREVALKVMRRDLAGDEGFVARFRREARSAARLSHPHVVSVTDQGSDEHYVFLAMELVRGRTLRSVIREDAPLPVGRALDLMDPVLDGLAAAHRAGLVHRDVKPENVLIGDDGVVKVTDFGLARAVSTDSVTADSNVLLGTASYLSPEQVEHGTVDERSDVYSAGLLLYELLTGAKAYPGDSPIHVAYQHVHGTMPRASDTVSTVPPEVDDLIALATAKDPQDRPTSAADLLVALRTTRQSLDHDTLEHAPARPRQRATPAPPRSPGRPIATPGRPPEPVNHTENLATATGRFSTAEDLPGPTPRSVYRRRRLALLLVPLLLVAAFAGWLFTLGPLGQVAVPTVRGQQQGAAVAALHQAGFRAKVAPAFSEQVPAGTVITTAPGSGTDVRRGSTVTLSVSKGPERYAVPALAGKTRDQAVGILASSHLKLGAVTEAYDEKVPSGRVISSDPASGASLKPGTAVQLVVSKGKQPIPVPDVTGKAKADAESQLKGLGLAVDYATDAYSDTVPSGSVISSDPPSGTTRYKGDAVTLTVSKGPEMVTVPNVIDLSSGEAQQKLEALGLTVKVQRVFGGIFDTVRDQSIAEGQQVRKGTTITLSVV
ncbi:Stk1 family PASTA domain-containing Ser/Thr kinase [Calidifontibacter sp. DB0510]|uniref:non-specific serine/threonine protein kinase n=1 Tax=Metallococcus carri TaxID=1656884 RepID=A0A967EA59_9MICO|nr:Stk1 family PASTA domain-containing Ser/Thr kinase [Metallococcus carri]NHN55935.1 Stk1 family PASTA domain-containing Ser/Thr kinase [Metallococcus carri]NOP37608.1 Stk1 family PASTA domain-containing Ser/Thr kinase [Calidifontibacter sp. DB2511S]